MGNIRLLLAQLLQLPATYHNGGASLKVEAIFGDTDRHVPLSASQASLLDDYPSVPYLTVPNMPVNGDGHACDDSTADSKRHLE